MKRTQSLKLLLTNVVFKAGFVQKHCQIGAAALNQFCCNTKNLLLSIPLLTECKNLSRKPFISGQDRKHRYKKKTN